MYGLLFGSGFLVFIQFLSDSKRGLAKRYVCEYTGRFDFMFLSSSYDSSSCPMIGEFPKADKINNSCIWKYEKLVYSMWNDGVKNVSPSVGEVYNYIDSISHFILILLMFRSQ